MPLSERDNKILDELIRNPGITSMALEQKYSLTRRQLGYSINKINDWLMSKNLPSIERTRQGHFVIDQSVFTKLDVKDESAPMETAVLTGQQRMQMIIMMLLSSKEELSLNHFTIELDVSKNTVLNDLKDAQTFLNDYDLTIRYSRKFGYLLEGKEFQIRKLLIKITYQILSLHDGERRLKELTRIDAREIAEYNGRIENVENKLNLQFTDEKLATMPYILILILRRIKKGYAINIFSIEYEELSNTKEYQATEEIFRDAEQIPMEERLFITLHLLTTNVYRTEFPTEEDVIPNLMPVIDDMLRLFEKSACIYLQERNQLLDKLLQHLKPAYYRIKYQLSETISLQGSLSTEFKELHHLVKRSIGPLADLIGSSIPDSEVTYITMLIGGWMKRQGESIEKKIKAIVVCPQGVSVSRLMFNELNELFPEFVFLDSLSVREFLNYSFDYDIVFAPTHLETNKKLFIAKAFLGREDKQRLRKQVMLELHGYLPQDLNVDELMEIIRNHATINNEGALAEDLQQYVNRDDDSSVYQRPSKKSINLDDLLTPETILLKNNVVSWEEAVRMGAAPLVESGVITADYVEAMLHYSEEDPYIVIGPNMAIPHASPEDGVNQVGISLLKLDEGVTFSSDYSIHLIIVISAVDKEQHLHALMQLMELAGSEHDRNRLISAGSVDEMYTIIQSYSSD
ncbi:BglG family transcription antiterminator [Lentibacillus amyloliquefaciens]|uniref:Ascorbate-specific PTS system EIIA component n=1 Tax=Lentibacillus amyloliquefaciens TaxID=1472767 RepID=A0A0U3NTQ9_9BACI|nr:BglG family transcription antiterminator [Lentibacillus amyloliquefaciens]ALX49979.1 transcription antiterminator BglG [Lentibacillus amyloliquefaciens]